MQVSRTFPATPARSVFGRPPREWPMKMPRQKGPSEAATILHSMWEHAGDRAPMQRVRNREAKEAAEMEATTAVAPGGLRADRLLSLDVLRGLTVAGMILVTDPGTYSHVYLPLTHAKWNGPTLTDLIFPCFLVMVGIAVALSLGARLRRGATVRELGARVVRRSVLLVGLGLVVNGFPRYELASLRIPGILQRIGICYLLVSLLYLSLSRSSLTQRARQTVMLGVCVASLGLYWMLLTLYPTPGFGAGHLDPLGDVAAVLDRHVFGQAHIFQWGIQTPGFGVTFDPEGILSTLGALGTTLFGVLAGEELRTEASSRRQCAAIASAGTMLWLLSLALSRLMPLNKQIYTPTFALWSAGLSLIAFAGLFWLIDIARVRRGWTLLLIFGTNAILAFCLSQVITSLLNVWHVRAEGDQPLYTVLAAHLFGTWLPPRPASLAWAICIVLLNAALLYPLYRRRIFLRL